MSWFELNWIELFDTELNWKCVELLNWFELPSLHCGQGGSRCFQFRSSHIVLQRNASFTNPTVSQSVAQLYYCVMAEIERVVLIDSFVCVCVLTSWSCTTFFDFMYMCVRKYMCVDVVFYSLKMYDTDFDRIFWGCCIWFHVICCAWTRVMFQIMECVASSISRWLGGKAE